MRRVVSTVGLIVGSILLLGIGGIKSGVFDVAATWPDPAWVHWALESTREASVARRARSVQVPDLTDRSMENGFRSYREMCSICHAPPGESISPTAEGMNPEPPDLKKEADHMSPAALFWVIKHGIRMTGMPAWGVTHSDDEIWDLVVFVKALPDMSAGEYQELNSRVSPGHLHRTSASMMGEPTYSELDRHDESAPVQSMSHDAVRTPH